MYQITIDGDNVSEPMGKEEAACWLGLLRVTFPGATIEATPLLCPECGNPLPEYGPCWHNRFPEEEAGEVTWEELLEAGADFRAMVEVRSGEVIPFLGEPMAGREVTPKDYIGL